MNSRHAYHPGIVACAARTISPRIGVKNIPCSRAHGARYGRVGYALCALMLTMLTPVAHANDVAKAEYAWSKSPHGRMLERTLPRSVEPATLPEPSSEGARLTARYCVQCHYLPAPHMHTARRWTSVVERMHWRMQGKGNMGILMKDMMAGVTAPSAGELATLTAYLQKHAQGELDAAHPALKSRQGQMFSIACSQCHALPDPKRHAVREWPGVVERMQDHMKWTNRIVGDPGSRTNPELNTAEILKWLQQHAK